MEIGRKFLFYKNSKHYLYLSFLTLFLLLGAPKNLLASKINIKYDSERATQLLQTKIQEAEVYTEPFPFIIIEDFLPDELLMDAIKFFPTMEQVRKIGGGYGNDGRVLISINSLQMKPKGINADFWINFSKTIRTLQQSIIDKFIDFIDIKFQLNNNADLENIKKSLKFTETVSAEGLYLQSHANLKPHFDSLKKFVQILLYLPEDNFHEDYGTKIFSGSPGKNLSKKFEHNNDLIHCLTLPYKKNVLVMFLQSPLSWHSSENYQDPTYLRKAYFTSVNLDTHFAKQFYIGESID